MTAPAVLRTRSSASHPRGARAWYQDQRGRGALEVGVLFVLLQLFCVAWYVIDQKGLNYLSPGNLGVMTQSGSWLALLAIGSGIVMMVGEIDLSVGANMGMSSHAQLAWVIILGTIMWVVIHRHRLGNHIAAVGGNEQAAKAISINPNRVRIYAFALLGLLAALGGILVSVQTTTLLPGSTLDYNLPAIAAAVIGGTAVKGGKGSVLGMVLGTFILKTFQALVLLSAVFPGFYLQVFTGGMLILFATINQYFESKAT